MPNWITEPARDAAARPRGGSWYRNSIHPAMRNSSKFRPNNRQKDYQNFCSPRMLYNGYIRQIYRRSVSLFKLPYTATQSPIYDTSSVFSFFCNCELRWSQMWNADAEKVSRRRKLSTMFFRAIINIFIRFLSLSLSFFTDPRNDIWCFNEQSLMVLPLSNRNEITFKVHT